MGLTRILLEESIASLGSKPVEITTPSGHTYLGRQQVGPLCGVMISDAGYPFLKFFNQMEPDAARGYIHMNQHSVDPRRRGSGSASEDESPSHEWRVERTDLPPNVAECKVLLFSGTSSDGGSACRAIEVLRGLRIPEARICVVTILSASEAVTALCTKYPGSSAAITLDSWICVSANVMDCISNSRREDHYGSSGCRRGRTDGRDPPRSGRLHGQIQQRLNQQ